MTSVTECVYIYISGNSCRLCILYLWGYGAIQTKLFVSMTIFVPFYAWSLQSKTNWWWMHFYLWLDFELLIDAFVCLLQLIIASQSDFVLALMPLVWWNFYWRCNFTTIDILSYMDINFPFSSAKGLIWNSEDRQKCIGVNWWFSSEDLNLNLHRFDKLCCETW